MKRRIVMDRKEKNLESSDVELLWDLMEDYATPLKWSSMAVLFRFSQLVATEDSE